MFEGRICISLLEPAIAGIDTVFAIIEEERKSNWIGFNGRLTSLRLMYVLFQAGPP